MSEPEMDDPRAMTDEELAEVDLPPGPADPTLGTTAVADDEHAGGGTSDPEGAHRDAPAGEDYAGSGF